MRDYSKVSRTLWHSRRFRPLESDAKVLYMHVLTGPHGNSIGCYRLLLGYITADLGWSEQRAVEALKHVSDSGLIDLYEPEELVRIDQFLHHNPITNMKHGEGAAKLALGLPDCEIKRTVIRELLAQKNLPSNPTIKGLERAIAQDRDRDRDKTETEIEAKTNTETEIENSTGLSVSHPATPATPDGLTSPSSETVAIDDYRLQALQATAKARAL